jgi:hypothetical protein
LVLLEPDPNSKTTGTRVKRVKLVRVRATMGVWLDFAVAKLMALAPKVGFKVGPSLKMWHNPRPTAQ